jgi:hypothetical protein
MAATRFVSTARVGLFAGLAGLVALAAGSACVQEQDYLVIDKAVWFESTDNCTLDAGADPIVTMTVDVMYASRIGLGLVVTNNQSPNANSNTGIDDSQIEVESAEVNLSFSGGAITGGSFEVTVPNNAIAGGDSLPFLVQVPSEVTDSIRAGMTPGQIEILEMEVVFKGRRYGASSGGKLGEVTTRAFTFPIDVCVGCLESCGICGFAQSGSMCEDDGGTGETGP